MTRYQVILSTDEATYIRDTVAPVADATVSPFSAGESGVEFGEAAKAHLEALPAGTDGHIDEEGALWIGGDSYPVSVLHNA